LAAVEEAAGNWTEAHKALETALAVEPDNVDARLYRIRLLKGSQKWRELWEDLEYLRLNHPKEARFWAEYGDFLQVNQSFEDALAAFSTGIELEPSNARLLHSRAAILRKLGRTEEAIADLDTAIELDPKHRFALIARAELELERGYPERTVADIAAARSLGPSAGDETSLVLAAAQIMLDQRARRSRRSMPRFPAGLPNRMSNSSGKH
jgi:tetratricopeptide (TPR) repeat protein